MRAKHGGTAQLCAEHLQGCANGLLVMRRRGNPCEDVRYEGNTRGAIPIDTLGHIGDEIAVTKMPLTLRHTDQDKIPFVCDIDQPLIYAWKVDTNIVEDQTDLAAVNQAHQIGALEVHIINAVEKAGNDDLAARVFVMRKDLVHKDTRVYRFQHRYRRHDFLEPACSAKDLCLTQRWQFEEI